MFNKSAKKSLTGYALASSENGNRYGGGGFVDFISPKGLDKWKPSVGPNKIDIIPYNASEKHPLVISGQIEKGEGLYSLDVYVHRGVGPSGKNIPCLTQFGKKCPLCEESNRLRNLGTSESEKQANDLYAKRRIIYIVHDLMNDKYGWWDTGFRSVEQKINSAAAFEVDETTGAKIDIYDWEEGKTIRFMGTEKTFNSFKFIEPDGFGFISRKPLSDEVLSHSEDLAQYLNMMTPEEMEKLISGEVNTSDSSSANNSSDENIPSCYTTPEEEPVEEKVEKKTEAPREPANKCPCGYKWGEADAHKKCATCEMWEKCIDG